MLRQIALLGHPVLRQRAELVALPVSESHREVAADLLATLREADGVGIAAPQVYESSRIFVVASRPNPRYPKAPVMEPEVVINPTILEMSEEIVKDWEGCLSIPGIRGCVPRHRSIRVTYRTLSGEEVEKSFTDFVARVFQHEYDHLEGIVFFDRLETPRDIMTEKEFQKQIVRGEHPDPSRT
jgi:peptide deformylase